MWSTTVKGFSVVNEAELEVFLEFSWVFMTQQMLAIWSLVPLALSKSSLNIWKFSVHVLLKPSLKDFEHYLSSMWNEHSCAVVWAFLGITFLWDWNENWPFPVHCWVFQICRHTECSTLTALSFRILNSSAGYYSLTNCQTFLLHLPSFSTPLPALSFHIKDFLNV